VKIFSTDRAPQVRRAVEAHMRLLVCASLLAGIASPALAGDVDLSFLRGSSAPVADPPNYARWSGVYGGVQVSEDFRGVDFRSVGGQSISIISGLDANFVGVPLKNFPQLSSMDTKGPGYGAFIGYNYQVDDIVAGLELNFNKSGLNAGMADTESHSYFITTNGALYEAKYNVTTTAAAAVAEYGTVRARLGWAFQDFLPYVFTGVSIAQVNASSSVNVNYSGQPDPSTPPPPPGPIGGNWTMSDLSHGKWYFGFDVGLGIDYALSRNIFVRGEIEYIQFGSPNEIKLNNASARVGLGLKY
jgi:outer membrane immunogenic protein